MRFSKIIATGSALPHKVVSNHEIANQIDTSDEWIVQRTGIHQRHVVSGNENTLSLAHSAAKNAILEANIPSNQIDLIIVATCTSSHHFPSTACQLQQLLGIENQTAAFDIAAACSGFIYAMAVADQMIRAGAVSTALVVGSETMSKTVDWNDRSTCVLFGDGAGAVILQANGTPGIRQSVLHANAAFSDILTYPKGQAGEAAYLHMQGKAVFKQAVRALEECVTELLHLTNLTPDQIDYLIPHQANIRIINAVVEKLGFDPSKVILTLAQHSNTSAASVPLALDFAIKNKGVKRGDILLLEAFGGGLTWGGLIIEY